MRISFRQVEIFWAVMTSGSVTKAAALLNTSQPTVSREITRFEHVLGIKLFNRIQGRLHPTAQSLTLFEEVKDSYFGLERIGHLAEAIKTFKGGQISVACLPAFSQSLLPYACAEFVRNYPEVNIAITAQESPLLEEWLTAQRYDLGLIEGAARPPGTQSQLLFTADVVCVLPRAHALVERAVITPQDLQGQSMVSLSSADPYRIQLDGILAREEVRCRSVIETASAAAVCFFVQQGLGIGVLNPLTALSLSGLNVAVRRFSISIPFSIHLITPDYRPHSTMASAFSQVLIRIAKDLTVRLDTLLG
jgi:DNA-binding transcriptional LysR family regulator